MSSRRSRWVQDPPKVFGPVRAYHWLEKPDELRGGEPTCVGKTHRLPDGEEPILCHSGFHASASFEVSLSYAPGFYLTRVELSGRIYGTEGDKYVASRRRSLWLLDVRPLLWEFAKPRLEAALVRLTDTFPTLPPEFAQALVLLEQGYADGSLPSKDRGTPDFLRSLRKLELTDVDGKTADPGRWYQAYRFIDTLDTLGRIYGLAHTFSALDSLTAKYASSSYQTTVAEFEAFVLSHAPQEPPMTPSHRRWNPDKKLRRRKTSKTPVALSLQPQIVTPALVKRIVRLATLYQERNLAYTEAQLKRDNQYYARQALMDKLPSPSSVFPHSYSYGYRYASMKAITPADVDAYLTEVKRAVRAVKKALPKGNAALETAMCDAQEKKARVDALKALYAPLQTQVKALTPKQRATLRSEVLAQWSASFPGQRSQLVEDLLPLRSR